MNLTFQFDPDMVDAPAGFEAALNKIATTILDPLILDPINVTIEVGFGSINGATIAAGIGGEGGPSAKGITLFANQVLTSLNTHSNSVTQGELPLLPANVGVQAPTGFISSAQMAALGITNTSTVLVDGYIGFGANYDWSLDNNPLGPNQVSLTTVTVHEVTHALGRIYGDEAMRFVQYTSPGVLAPAAGGGYFSLDGGKTNLGAFDTATDTTDWANAPGDMFNLVTHPGEVTTVTPVDRKLLAALGFNVAQPASLPSPPLSNTDFITLLYQNALGRAPDPAGLNYWSGVLTGGTSRLQVADMVAKSNEGEVWRLYGTTFNRPADPSGEQFWITSVTSGTSINQVATAFSQSPEFQNDYSALSTIDFVSDLYHNALHRDPDSAGLNAWVSLLQSGSVSRGDTLVGFSDSKESIGFVERGLV